jgi:dienelactone hydrolase
MNMHFLRISALLLAAALTPPVARAADKLTVPATATTPAVPAYVAKPAGSTPSPAVLLLHGCEGFNGTYAGYADALARHGYVVVAIDSLAPTGKKSGCSDPTASREQAADARATLAWMQTQPYIDAQHIALLGYSMGSIAALDVIDNRAVTSAPAGLRAAVLYYPACRGRDPQSILVPLRIFDGDADDWIPAPPCQDLAGDAAAAGKSVTITTYPGATHAFNVNEPDRVYQGHHLSYDAAAAADADKNTLAFLQQYLSPKP